MQDSDSLEFLSEFDNRHHMVVYLIKVYGHRFESVIKSLLFKQLISVCENEDLIKE